MSLIGGRQRHWIAVEQLLRLRAPWLVVAAAHGLYLLHLVRSSFNPVGGEDNLIVANAAEHVLNGVSPYVEKRLLYPPSSVPFALLEAPFSDATLRHLSPFIVAACLLVAWWASLRLFDLPMTSWAGIIPVGFAAYFVPSAGIAGLGSWTAPVAAAAGVAFLLMGQSRWLPAGVVIGVSIAVKPMLMPLALILLFARQWKAFIAAAAIPATLCAVTLLLLPQPELFFTNTVPFLLSGQDAVTYSRDGSLPIILEQFGLPAIVVAPARVVVLAGAVLLAWLRWRAAGDQRVRVVEAGALLMVGTFLVSTPTFAHYAMIVVPALAASIMAPDSIGRTLLFWLSLLPLMAFFELPYIDYPAGSVEWPGLKTFLWLLTLSLALAIRAVRPHLAVGDQLTPASTNTDRQGVTV